MISDETELLKKTHNHSHDHSQISELFTPTNLSWEDMISNCGARVMVENSARANEIFNRKFFKKSIEWKGYFLSAYIQAYNPFDFNPEHVLNLNIRMIPSESLKNPDLFLSLDANRYNKFLPEIRKLKTGDPIKFRASFEALGNEWRPHHLHLISIEKIEDFIDKEKKILLFKGVEFDIEGHLKNEEKINQLQKQKEITEKKLNNEIPNNKTQIKTPIFEKNSTDSHQENKINSNETISAKFNKTDTISSYKNLD